MNHSIEWELSASKNVNSKLHERVVALERQCCGNSQYSRHECLEIISVPDSISNDDLEETTLKMFDKLDVTIEDANHIRKNKRELNGMNVCSTGINNPVFINNIHY